LFYRLFDYDILFEIPDYVALKILDVVVIAYHSTVTTKTLHKFHKNRMVSEAYFWNDKIQDTVNFKCLFT